MAICTVQTGDFDTDYRPILYVEGLIGYVAKGRIHETAESYAARVEAIGLTVTHID